MKIFMNADIMKTQFLYKLYNVIFKLLRSCVIFYLKTFWPKYKLDLRSYRQLFVLVFKVYLYPMDLDLPLGIWRIQIPDLNPTGQTEYIYERYSKIDQHLARYFKYNGTCLSSSPPFLCSQIINPSSHSRISINQETGLYF